MDAILDLPDLYSSSESIPRSVANLLSQASGQKSCRILITSPRVKGWLDQARRQVKDLNLRAASAVALVKLSQGTQVDTADATESGLSNSTEKGEDDTMELAALMKDLVVSNTSANVDAVEGLAYLSVQPAVKETLSRDREFLRALFSLLPKRSQVITFPASHAERPLSQSAQTDLGLDYGVAVIILHLCSYRPRLSDEEKQIDRLRRMTKEPGGSGKLSSDDASQSEKEKLDDDEHVRARCRRLLESGAVNALAGIVREVLSRGHGARGIPAQRAIAAALLSIAEEKDNRGKMLQEGGAKALLSIIQTSLIESAASSSEREKGADVLDKQDLLAIQALAKVSITSPPTAVFGPSPDSYIDAIRPFAVLLCHSSSTLLQRFEAVMALTNIASISPEAASRISAFRFKSTGTRTGAGDIIKATEGYLLDNNVMLRRAATELICNIVGGDEMSFNYFGGTVESDAKSKLHILLALSDVDDLHTRLAASGALAVLTASPFACRSLAKLEMERHRVLPILVEMISPAIAGEYREGNEEEEMDTDGNTGRSSDDVRLIHRGVVCVQNLFGNLDSVEERKAMSIEAERKGLLRALLSIIKSPPEGPSRDMILRSAADVLKWVMQAGVKLPI